MHLSLSLLDLGTFVVLSRLSVLHGSFWSQALQNWMRVKSMFCLFSPGEGKNTGGLLLAITLAEEILSQP
jgi:hypothetical protein